MKIEKNSYYRVTEPGYSEFVYHTKRKYVYAAVAPYKWDKITIKYFEDIINTRNFTVKKLTEDEVFLEMI